MVTLDLQTFFVSLTISLAVLFFLFYVVLFGHNHTTPPISTLHTLFTATLPTFLHTRILSPLCGSSNRATSFTHQVARGFEKYVMPLAYLLLLMTGLYFVNLIVVSRLPELLVIDPEVSPCPRSRLFCHRPTAIPFPPSTPPHAIYVYAFLALTSWLSVFLTDPGIISKRSFLSFAPLYPYDDVIFPNGTRCRTCLLPKLARSRHCALCNRCVARSDHHCGWVGNCVGFYNTGNFVIFLAVHCVMLLHGMLVAMELVYAKMLYLIDGKFVFVPTNTPITSFSLKIAWVAETNLCCLVFVLAFTFILVFAFLMYHISLVLRNKTTNESSKWGAVYDVCTEYPRKHGGTSFQQALVEEALSDAAKDGVDSATALAQLPLFDERGFPVNIYDRGILANVFEVFAPRWFQARFKLSKEQKSNWLNAVDDHDKD